MTTRTPTNIFRYKFSENVLAIIGEFTNTHKYDEPIQFREEWDLFVIENKEQLDRERNRLTLLGYNGNVDEKMYKKILSLDIKPNFDDTPDYWETDLENLFTSPNK